MALDAQTIYGFVNSMLYKHFDAATTSPDFHTDLWSMCTSDHRWVAIAAPRGHAKSTAISIAYTISAVLFNEHNYVVIVSDTESQAINFVGNIKHILTSDPDIQALFGFRRLLKDAESDIIGEFEDGKQFRIVAKGAEQKLRGLLWKGQRPNLIIGDDLENDEVVMNKERREKFKQWFFGALIPSVSRKGKVRVVGTILHLDSLLENLLGDDTWYSARYAAHNRDFSEILWPANFTEDDLKSIRRSYANQGYPEGYAKEYLNFPIDEENSYFDADDFLPIENRYEPHYYYAAIDFAISKESHADWTVMAVIGVNSEGICKVVDIRRGRWDGLEIMDEMFSLQAEYDLEMMTVEKGAIEKALGPFIYSEMGKNGKPFIHLNPLNPDRDKVRRARSIQARMRAGKMQFDKDAYWYPDLEAEMLVFPRGKHDDQVDALAWVGLTLDKMYEGPTVDELEDEEWEEEFGEDSLYLTRNPITGY